MTSCLHTIPFNCWSRRYFNQKYGATLLNIEINKIVNFFFSVSLFSVISIVEQFQSHLGTFSQTFKENVMKNLKIKKKKSSYCTNVANAETAVGWAGLRRRLLHDPGSCVGWNTRAGGGRAREEEEEEVKEEEVQMISASFHLLWKWLAWRMLESPGHSIDCRGKGNER